MSEGVIGVAGSKFARVELTIWFLKTRTGLPLDDETSGENGELASIGGVVNPESSSSGGENCIERSVGGLGIGQNFVMAGAAISQI